ncbi:MAG: SurA N-terminal domain-containing protein [Armatimonadetes bacterium]|nr:SurA N-terminal domain-containing protein [Armatimonadota bacterium]
MKRSFFLTLAVLALASIIVALVFVGCGGGSPKIATVQGAAISQEAFLQHMKTKAMVRVVLSNGQVVELPIADTMAFQTIQDLITQQILLQLAEDAGLLPDEDEVEAEIEFRKRLNPNFVDSLRSRGYTQSQIRREVSVDLARERLLTRGIVVTIDEIETLIKERPEQFMDPATIDMYYILVTSEAGKQNVDAALASARKFKDVAAKLSEAPNAARTQGRFPERRLDQLSPAVRELVEATPVNGITEWLQIDQNWVMFLIEGRTAAAPIDMTDDRKEYARRQIALGRGRLANDLTAEVGKRLKDAEVEISADEESIKSSFARFQEQLQAGDTAGINVGTSPTEDSVDSSESSDSDDGDESSDGG